MREALCPLFRRTGNDDQMVKAIRRARFEDQSSFHNRDRIRIASTDVVHPLVFVRNHGRMDDRVKFLHARRASRNAPVA